MKVASHTNAHRCVFDLTNEEIEKDEGQNAAFFSEHLDGYEAVGFAYPYGEISVRTKLLYSKLYPVKPRHPGRGQWPPVRSQPIESGRARTKILVQGADRVFCCPGARKKCLGWSCSRNDVSETPSIYGATPEMLEHAILDNSRRRN